VSDQHAKCVRKNENEKSRSLETPVKSIDAEDRAKNEKRKSLFGIAARSERRSLTVHDINTNVLKKYLSGILFCKLIFSYFVFK